MRPRGLRADLDDERSDSRRRGDDRVTGQHVGVDDALGLRIDGVRTRNRAGLGVAGSHGNDHVVRALFHDLVARESDRHTGRVVRHDPVGRVSVEHVALAARVPDLRLLRRGDDRRLRVRVARRRGDRVGRHDVVRLLRNEAGAATRRVEGGNGAAVVRSAVALQVERRRREQRVDTNQGDEVHVGHG